MLQQESRQKLSKTEQLKEGLLRRIKAGSYPPGSTLPSIEKLCSDFNVSKHTVSQALSNLSELGVIDLSHGKSTQVSENPFGNTIEILYVGLTPLEQMEFWAEVYGGIIEELKLHPTYKVNMRQLQNVSAPYNWLDKSLKSAVGVLLIGCVNTDLLARMRAYAVKSVLVYDRASGCGLPAVSVRFDSVMEQLALRFLAKGCSRVAYIGYFIDETAAEVPARHNEEGVNLDKLRSFRQAMARHGAEVPEKRCLNSDHRIADGYRMAKKLLEANPEVDGIMLSSDMIAPGVYRALYESGRTVGKDVYVASCDNLEIAGYLVPSLTSIELSRRNIGRESARQLIRQLQEDDGGEDAFLTPELIVRESL